MSATETGIRGVWVRGDDPKELVLSDGSRLLLEPSASEDGDVGWRRTDGRDGTAGTVSVPEALELAGAGYGDYVTVRTRAEAEWLRAVAEWCAAQASRLDRELGVAAA